MYLDISRDRFDPAKHYSAVLLQQGRVILDSDVIEQAAIWAHQARTALADLVGPFGAPVGAAAFQIQRATATSTPPDLTISAGRAYIGGVLIEVEAMAGAQPVTYLTQPDGYIDPDADKLPTDSACVLYLRVWERSVTMWQDPCLREVALGIHGPDTTARAQVVWQVAAWWVTDPGTWVAAAKQGAVAAPWQSLLRDGILGWLAQPGRLIAQARQPAGAETDICSVSPQAQYRGVENLLYRVEIAGSGMAAQPSSTGQSSTGQSSTGQASTGQSGTGRASTGKASTGRASARKASAGQQSGADPGQPGSDPSQLTATCVWSRNNGADVYAIGVLAGAEVTVTTLGRDIPSQLNTGDWVEIVDDASASRVADERPLARWARAFFQVTAIDAVNRVVTLDRDPAGVIATTGTDPTLHPLLRRWEGVGTGAGIPVTEGSWLPLEDGVQVKFPGSGDPTSPAGYRNGDYWLIPARTALGDVIWPQDAAGPKAMPPTGVTYRYAPVALVPAGSGTSPTQLLQVFDPLPQHAP